MSEPVLTVARLEARYRLRAGEWSVRERLDGVLSQLLDTELEQALGATGLPLEEEICVRRVDAPASIRLTATDSAIARTWSRALAEQIRRAAEEGGADVARFGSRVHALHDLVRGIARGDLTRAWAWAQLGLWRDGVAPGDALVLALRAEPRAAVHALAAAAEAGLLPQVLDVAGGDGLRSVARAALEAGGYAEPASGEAASFDALAEAATARILARSRLCRAAVASAGRVSRDRPSAEALALLAVLEVEPALLAYDVASGSAVVAGVAERLGAPATARDAPPVADGVPQSEPTGSNADAASRASDPDRARAAPVEPGRDHASDSDSGADAEVPLRSSTGGTSDNGRWTEADELAAADVQHDSANAETDASERVIVLPEAGADEASPLPERVRALTRHGGLLFLLGVVEELGLPESMAADPVLARRGLRWSLHRLALELAATAENDPAVLAFCGLAPTDDPPSVGEPPPDETESAVLTAHADEVATLLAARLGREDEPPREAVAFTVSRRAEVVADPGWIELRFAFEDVDLDIRRAGLDLDPDFVPWLGVIVRFRYE